MNGVLLIGVLLLIVAPFAWAEWKTERRAPRTEACEPFTHRWVIPSAEYLRSTPITRRVCARCGEEQRTVEEQEKRTEISVGDVWSVRLVHPDVRSGIHQETIHTDWGSVHVRGTRPVSWPHDEQWDWGTPL